MKPSTIALLLLLIAGIILPLTSTQQAIATDTVGEIQQCNTIRWDWSYGHLIFWFNGYSYFPAIDEDTDKPYAYVKDCWFCRYRRIYWPRTC